MLKWILKRPVGKQFSAFIFVGLTATVLNYLVFLIFLNFLFFSYLFSAGAGFVSGLFFGFIFNKTFTYNSKRKISKSLPLYVLVYSITLIINLVLLDFLVKNVFSGPIISNATLILPITILNFLGTKIVAFNNREW